MKYLVTGAAGFLGRHLACAIEASGDSVVRYSRSTGGDILDPARVRAAAYGCVGVFHCAGRVSRRKEDAEDLYRLHVEGTKVVLDACAQAGVKRAVVASTSGTVAVADDPRREATEEDRAPIELFGRWPYYRSKFFAEKAALARSCPGFDVVCINPSLLLGPGDVNGSSTGDVAAFVDGKVWVAPSGGLSFVDVRDAAEAMRVAMDRGRPGERYLVGACNCSFGDFFARLARVSGRPAPFVLPRSRHVARVGAALYDRASALFGSPAGDGVAADMGQYFWYLDASKAARDLAFRPRDPQVTLHETVADLIARGVVWPRIDRSVAR